MRTLCVAGVYPWPANDGYRMRLAAMIDALVETGEVDVLCPVRMPDDVVEPPAGVRAGVLPVGSRTRAKRLWRWLRSDLPRAHVRAEVDAANIEARRWLADHYDLAYLSHLSSWVHHRELVSAPTIVDLDNLDNLVIRVSRTARPRTRDLRQLPKWAVMWPVEWIDERRTEKLQRRCAANVDRVTLCSALDVERSGFPNAVVIANGYERIVEPPAERTGHVLLFVGGLAYPPNADAVTWFANEVFPLVRKQLPSTVFRVVGHGVDHVAAIGELPGVELVGRVDDLQPELDAACATVVPIRFGSGTRLKVIEALANRLPLVSTPLGAEGTEVVDGVHAMLESKPARLAEACVRVLEDPDLRDRLATEGERLWQERFRWSTIRAEMAALARQVAGA